MIDVLGKNLVESDLTLTGMLTQNLRRATETKLTTTPRQDIMCPCWTSDRTSPKYKSYGLLLQQIALSKLYMH